MRHPNHQQVRAMRTLLKEARVDNSRMVAAAIGGHLFRITRQTGSTELDDASESVRDASLHLLKALQQSDGVTPARAAALRSVDSLESALPDGSIVHSEPLKLAGKVGPLRRLAQRTIPALRFVRQP